MAFVAYTLTIATPGTPQQASAGAGQASVIMNGVTYPSGASTPRARVLLISSLPTNTAAKFIYVGGPNLNITAKTGICYAIPVGGSITIGQDDTGFSLDQVWVDTDSANAATEKVGIGIVG